MKEIKLPPEGIFVGSGVYPTDTDTLLCTMIGHYCWQSQYFGPMEMIDKIVSDNQGNLAQVWGCARGFSPRLPCRDTRCTRPSCRIRRALR